MLAIVSALLGYLFSWLRPNHQLAWESIARSLECFKQLQERP
jgi:hypothetical protein